MLAATSRITVATGIVNMWATPAAAAAASYHRIEAAHPGRFLLGVGIGHPEATSDYRRPYATMVGYLDALEAAGVPVAGRALAALGPRGEPGPRLRAGPCSRTPATTVTAATVSRDGTPGAPAAR